MQRPDWWDWELAFTYHVELRMEDRDFTELELRRMLEVAGNVLPGRAPGRFEVYSRQRGKPWLIILEPDFDEQLLYVVTAYPRDDA
jgi:hypothetical protein